MEEERISREVERREREKCEKCKREMEARMEQNRAQRDDGRLSVSTLQEGWERPSRDILRFRS